MLAIGASGAAAATTSERPLLFTFDGSDSSAGAFVHPVGIEIDQATGTVYVLDQGHNVIDKFNLAGVAQSFSSTGSSSLSPGPAVHFNELSDVAVDNSATNPGRIYAIPEFGPLVAFNSAGQSLWTIPGNFEDLCGVAVDPAGHPWIGNCTSSIVREYGTSGSPPAEIGSIDPSPDHIFHLDFDASGNAYMNRYFGGVDKYEGGAKVSTLDSDSANGVTVDRSSPTGHVFTLHSGSFNEYDSSGALLGTFASEIIAGGGGGIAYDHASDHVYVADYFANKVEVFGPAVSGTVPDVSIEPSTEVGVNKATFHGTVNPQSVPNSYRFEWKQGTSSSWGSAESSPPVTLPEDSSDHAVSFTATTLGGGREYQVRLVALNTEKNLRAVSGTETFSTSAGSTPPSVSIDEVTSVTATSAHVSGSIDTQEDLTEWRVQLSSDPACAGGFQNLPPHTIVGGHAGSDTVSQELENLSPAEHYCVRIVATNSAGVNETQELTVNATAGTFKLSFEGQATGWVGEGKLAPASTSVTEVATSAGTPAVGEAIFGAGVKPNTTIVAYSPGSKSITLSQPAEPSVPSSKSSLYAELRFDATASAVQNALNALSTIGGAGGSVSVTGGPGDEGGTHPYDITFGSTLAEKNLPQLAVNNLSLSGGGASAAVTTTTNGASGSTTSETKEFETLETPVSQVFTAFAAPRTDTTARLNGYLNPVGSIATYRFEYSADGSNWTPLPDAQTEAGIRRQVIVAEEVSGLQPSTTYHYRFVVENGGGQEQGEEKSFQTRTSAEMQLPKRGIELVNQPDKGNQNMGLQRPDGHPSMVSEDGETAVWDVFAGAPGGNTGTEVYFISKRTPNGWVSHGLTPPAEEQAGGGTNAYLLNQISPDFKSFIFRSAQTGVLTEGPATLVRVDDEQHQDVLKAFSAAFPDEEFETYKHSDQTDDGSHVLVVNPEDHQLEEISEGHSEIVSIMSDGTPNECGLSKSSFSGSGNDASGPTWYSGYHRMDVHDASRLYFQAVPNGGSSCSVTTQYQGAIFYRDRNTEETIEVDAGTGSERSEMIRATPDGRSLYFITWLSHSPSDLNSTGDIYRWDAETDEYTCLTCVVPEVKFSGSSIRISDDFSHIYFTASNQLVPGYGNPGQGSLYVLSNGEIKYISESLNENLNHVEMSNDGNVLLFETENGGKGLTTDKLASSCEDQEGNVYTDKCAQVYRYEDSTGSLECLTCKPGGVTDKTAGSSGVLTFFDVSSDGSTAAMVTREALLPEDVNNVADVYEWRNGAVGLVSDGETIYPSRGLATAPKVYGIDRTGDNIFFSLADPGLTGYEQDGLSNLYDARIGGGFPRPQPVVHCVEESCNGPLEAVPSPGSTNSSAFSGPGNLPSQARKRKGRCVRKRGAAKARCLHRHRKPRHHRRHHRGAQGNRGGAK